MTTDVDTVAALLAAAGLTVPPAEVERLAQLYPGLRRSMDRMYEIPTGDEVPAAVFRAAEIRPPGAEGSGAAQGSGGAEGSGGAGRASEARP